MTAIPKREKFSPKETSSDVQALSNDDLWYETLVHCVGIDIAFAQQNRDDKYAKAMGVFYTSEMAAEVKRRQAVQQYRLRDAKVREYMKFKNVLEKGRFDRTPALSVREALVLEWPAMFKAYDSFDFLVCMRYKCAKCGCYHPYVTEPADYFPYMNRHGCSPVPVAPVEQAADEVLSTLPAEPHSHSES